MEVCMKKKNYGNYANANGNRLGMSNGLYEYGLSAK